MGPEEASIVTVKATPYESHGHVITLIEGTAARCECGAWVSGLTARETNRWIEAHRRQVGLIK